MIRGIAAVIVGYIVMSLIVGLGLTGAYIALGADTAFQPGSWEVSMVWLGVWFVVGLIAALIGGWLASKIAAGPGGVRALAVIVLLLGLALAGAQMVMEKPDPGPRGPDVSSMDAMQKAEQPPWVAFLTPVIGFLGVSIGGRGAKRKAR